MSLLPSDLPSLLFLGLLTTVWVGFDSTRPERQPTGHGQLVSRRSWADIAVLSLVNITVDALLAWQAFVFVDHLFAHTPLVPLAALSLATVAVKRLLRRSFTQQVRMLPEGLNITQWNKQRLFQWNSIEHVSPFLTHSVIQRHGTAPGWLRQYHLACTIDLSRIRPHIKPTVHLRTVPAKQRSR
ncbi:hypothetical protein [Deinococcus ficus]|uniref:hypothetical protein n=1 Tax=Deinococcus ficus TaxID=317577 RepID=UPI000487F732|nr:hypothetical protein [Deinococcus ficus]